MLIVQVLLFIKMVENIWQKLVSVFRLRLRVFDILRYPGNCDL